MDTKSNVRNILVMKEEWLNKGESLYFDGGRKGCKLYIVFKGEVPGWVYKKGEVPEWISKDGLRCMDGVLSRN